MSNCNHINQYRQIHMGTHIYHVYNILSDLTLMLDFLVITIIATFVLVMMETFNHFRLLVYSRYWLYSHFKHDASSIKIMVCSSEIVAM